MGFKAGFTVTELMITVSVMVILLATVQVVSISSLASGRDSERYDDVAAIARRLEQAYIAQDVGKPAYPTTQAFMNNVSSRTGTMSRISEDAFYGPGETSLSIKAAKYQNLVRPLGGDDVTPRDYVYQPLTIDDWLCDDPSYTCVKFNLYYKFENNDTLRFIKSVNQQ